MMTPAMAFLSTMTLAMVCTMVAHAALLPAGSADDLLPPSGADNRHWPHGDLPLGLELGHSQGVEDLVEEVWCPINPCGERDSVLFIY